MGLSLWTHCPHPWSGIFPTAGAMEGVGVGSYSASLSTSHPHSPVTRSQSLAAITAIKTINALRSGSTFDLLGCRWNQHCCISGKVLFTRARCSFSWLPCCSSTVKFALGWVWVCVESSAVIRPQLLAAALLLFSLLWLCPLLGSLSPSREDIPDGHSSVNPGLLALGISCSVEPFPEDLLMLRLLERSPRSGFTCSSP